MKTFDEIFTSLPEEDRKAVTAHIDSSVSKGVNSYRRNHPASVAEAFTALNRRMDRIEKQRAEREHDYSMTISALKHCQVAGVAFGLVEDILPSFKDEAALISKIDALSELSKNGHASDANRAMAESSFKPGMGSAHHGTIDMVRDYADRPLEERLAMLNSGTLDRMIQGKAKE